MLIKSPSKTKIEWNKSLFRSIDKPFQMGLKLLRPLKLIFQHWEMEYPSLKINCSNNGLLQKIQLESLIKIKAHQFEVKRDSTATMFHFSSYWDLLESSYWFWYDFLVIIWVLIGLIYLLMIDNVLLVCLLMMLMMSLDQ